MEGSGSPNRVFSDWIDEYTSFAHDPDQPLIYTRWAAISAVSAVLERKVWAHLRPEPFFPNMYIMLVGPPGGGKSTAINRAKAMVRQVRNERQRFVKFAPDDVTKAALIDALKSALVIETAGDSITEQSPLYLSIDELGTAITFIGGEMLSFLSKMFDAEPSYQEQRRGKGDKALVIPYPLMSVIAGVQPGYLAQQVPPHAWEQGFFARFIMAYADPLPQTAIFSRITVDHMIADGLQRDLTQIFQLQGGLDWSKAGHDALVTLVEEGITPVPLHEQLRNYTQRRPLFIAKLAMISACSSSNSMIITERDVLRAREWLLEVEATMPSVFARMHGPSDDMILNEARRAIALIYFKTGRAVPTSVLYQILSRTAKANQLKALFQAAIHRGDYQPGDEETGWNSLIPSGADQEGHS